MAKVTKLLIDAGAGLDIQNLDGLTALMVAAMDGSVDVVEDLIAAGADVNARTPWNEGALSCALTERRSDTAAALLQAGADPDLRITQSHPDPERRGRTPREMAAASRSKKLRALFP